jgi:Family of unknown function (DUF5691)
MSGDHWSTITTAVTLGTQRGAPELGQVWPSSELSAPADQSPERALLRAAAANYLWQLAGMRFAPQNPPAIVPAPPAESRQVSEIAAWRLAKMLSGDRRELVSEWLSLAARAGSVIPLHWLPVALNGLQPGERAAGAAVLGVRAQWLAQQNPEWADMAVSTAGSPIDRWHNGTLPERRAALTSLRAADPAGALALLQQSWQTEPPDVRAAFLETLLSSPGLSDGDEAFLEGALSDKRKDVRMAAVECLCRLPRSAHALRNIERLRPLLVLTEVEKSLLSRFRERHLEITLPESLDRQAARDGINAKPAAQHRIGERAYLLMQMVAMAPPAHWCERFQCDIDTFLKAVLATDYATDLILALSQASVRHAAQEWIAPLSMELLQWYGQSERALLASQMLPTLISAVPATAQDAILQRLFGACDPHQFQLLESALLATNVEWSAETTRLAFALLEKRIQPDRNQYPYPRQLLERWGLRAQTESAHREILRLLERAGEQSPWKNALESLQSILDFRLTMKQELLP